MLNKNIIIVVAIINWHSLNCMERYSGLGILDKDGFNQAQDQLTRMDNRRYQRHLVFSNAVLNDSQYIVQYLLDVYRPEIDVDIFCLDENMSEVKRTSLRLAEILLLKPTCLMAAMAKFRINNASLLVNFSQLQKTDQLGNTALEYAIMYRYTDLLKQIKLRGNFNYTINTLEKVYYKGPTTKIKVEQETPIELKRRLDIIQAIFDSAVNDDEKTLIGKQLHELAFNNKDRKLFDFLYQKGISIADE